MQLVVIGGGVAGVSCAEELGRLLPDDVITLLSASDVLKGVRGRPCPCHPVSHSVFTGGCVLTHCHTQLVLFIVLPNERGGRGSPRW